MITVRAVPRGGKYVAIPPVRAIGSFGRLDDRHQRIQWTERIDYQVSVLPVTALLPLWTCVSHLCEPGPVSDSIGEPAVRASTTDRT